MTEYLPLAKAAALAFPDGSVKISALRKERDRGNLRTYLIGAREFTTLEDISNMVEKCVVTPKARGSGSGRNAETREATSKAVANGSSEMVDTSAALEHALRIVKQQKKPSSAISPRSMPLRGLLDPPPPSLLQMSSQSMSRTEAAGLPDLTNSPLVSRGC